jgi:hypothetical protein
MEIEIVGVHGDGFVFEFDDDLDAVSLGARRKVQKRMLIQAKLGQDAVEAGVGRVGHPGIVEHACVAVETRTDCRTTSRTRA